jgi:Cys-rich repeat protein
MTTAEANPQCSTSAQCTGGQVCLNAQCVTL